MNDKLDSYIEKVKHLPAAPTVLVKLVSMFQKPDRDVDEIVELMRQDPSLTAEVLRQSNSAYYGWEEPIVDVFDAITRMGFYEVYQTATARLGSHALRLPPGVSGADVEKLWRHSATAGVTSGVIAQRVQENESLAFTAGLLHDIGKIVLNSAEGAKYGAVINEVGDGGPNLDTTEAMRFGFGHSEVGGRLLSRWGLPDDIWMPVNFHHQVNWPEPIQRICAVISLGNIMAHAAEANVPGNPYESHEAAKAMQLLDLREDDMVAMLDDAREDIEHMTDLLGSCK
jgi:putative nucleotidyltransferase with HDIG domain